VALDVRDIYFPFLLLLPGAARAITCTLVSNLAGVSGELVSGELVG
jgi:hypothetical protein